MYLACISFAILTKISRKASACLLYFSQSVFESTFAIYSLDSIIAYSRVELYEFLSWNWIDIFLPFTEKLIHLLCIVQFSKYNFDAFASLVGLGGLEPPTSRLSGVRSSLLSYKPISSQVCALLTSSFTRWWRWGESNSWPPACKAGALPAELRPHY